MGNQFKPGDLAVIVGFRFNPENLGKACELIEFLEPGKLSIWVDPTDGCRLRSGTDEPCWIVVGETIANGSALVAPRHLRPLRGEFEPEQQTQREAAPCA